MIIKGGAGGNVGFWGNHLQDTEKNERAEVIEIKGVVADDLKGALREMQVVAAGSRSQGNFMYQANINVPAYEHLTPQQWQQAWDTLERNMGLEGHQRVVVEHEKEGRVHQHAIWNRVDVDTMRVADIGGNYKIHERTARDLERSFDLTPTPTPAIGERRAPAELWEARAEERSGILRAEVKSVATEAWRETSTGDQFIRVVEAEGLKVARGDRRDFVFVDQAGDVHSMARRIEGVKAADIRDRMHDVNRDALPSVQEARQEQRERHPHLARAPRPRAAVEPSNTISDDLAPIKLGSAVEGVRAVADTGLKVLDKVTGAVEKLADFMADMFTGTTPEPAGARPNQAERIAAQARAADALEKIAESIKRREPIGMDDVRLLTPDHLRDIRDHGDDYVRELVDRANRDRSREREHERWRGMER